MQAVIYWKRLSIKIKVFLRAWQKRLLSHNILVADLQFLSVFLHSKNCY